MADNTDSSYFDFLRSDPAFAGKSNLELLKLSDPVYGTASDGKTPMSDRAIVQKVMEENGIPEDQFDDFAKYMGLEKTGPLDELVAGFDDGVASMSNYASNAYPAALGRIAQDKLSPELNEFLGTQELVDSNLEDFKKQEQLNSETSQTQAPGKLEDAKTFGDYMRSLAYNTGNTAASWAEVAGETAVGALVGAGIGLATAGPPGAIAGAVEGGAAGTAARQGAKALLKNAVKDTLTKEVLTSAAVTKGAKYGAMTGATAKMDAIMTGQYDQDLLERKIDNPTLAFGMGKVAALIEFAPELAALSRVNKAFQTPAGKEALANALFSRAAGKDFVKTLGKEVLHAAPAEGLVNMTQDGLTELADKAINDADLDTPEVRSRMFNSFMSGMLGSAGIAVGSAAGQTVGKYPLFSPASDSQSATDLIRSHLTKSPVSEDSVQAARDSGVEVSDDDAPPAGGANTKPVDIPPSPVVTPEQAATSTSAEPTLTPDFVQKRQQAKDAVAANVEKAGAVGEIAAKVEAKETANRRNPAKAKKQVNSTGFVLPKEIAGDKPTYNGKPINWNNDLEKALYIVANQKTKSGSHAKYVAQIKAWKPDWTDADIAKYGKQVVAAVKSSVTGETPLVTDFLTQDKSTEVPLMTKEDGRVAQVGDPHETIGVTKSKLITPSKQDEIFVSDNQGGRANFTLGDGGKTASVVGFSKVDPAVVGASPEVAKTRGARPFLANTVKALKQLGVNKVVLAGANEITPKEVKDLVDSRLLVPDTTPGSFIVGTELGIPKEAIDNIMAKFHKDGKEHGALVLNGEVVPFEAKSNSSTNLTIPDSVAELMTNSSGALHLVHNHPRSSTLSLEDLTTTACYSPNKTQLVISAIFGTGFSTAEMDLELSQELRRRILWGYVSATGDAYRIRVMNAVRRGIIDKGATQALMQKYSDRVGFEPLLLALDDAGMIKYSSNIGLSELMAKEDPELFTALLREAKAAVSAFISNLKREGIKYEKQSRSGIDYSKAVRGSKEKSAESEGYRRLLSGVQTYGLHNGLQVEQGVAKTQEVISPKGSLPLNGLNEQSIQKTPLQHEQNYQDLMRKLSAAIKQVAGETASVEFWNTLTAKTDDGKMRDLRGYQTRHTIAVALGVNSKQGFDPLETSFHEAFHAIYQMLPASDKAILEAGRAELQKYVRRHMRSLYGVDLPTIDLDYFDAEELGAAAFGLYAKRKADGVEAQQSGAFKILNKIHSLLKQMGRIIAGQGYKSADDVFAEVFRGDYADGKLSGDTSVRLQEDLSVRASQKAADFNEKRYFANTDADEIARDKGLSHYATQVADTISRGVPPKVAREYGNLAYFFDLLKSIPGIARSNPLAAQAMKLLRGIHEETRAVMADFAVGTNDILTRGADSIVAAEHMDYMSANGVIPDFYLDDDGNNYIRYKNKEGKSVTLKGSVADAYIALHHQFKKVLGMQEALLTHDLPDDIRTLEQYQEYLVSKGPEISKEDEIRLRVWQKLRSTIQSKQPYFPQMRFGEHAIKVERLKADGTPEMVGFWMLENDLLSATGQPNKAQEARVRKEIEAKYGGNAKYIISNTFKLTNNDVANLFDHSKMRTEEVISGFLGDELAKKLAGDLGVPQETLEGSIESTRDAILNHRAFLERFERKIDKMFGSRDGYDGYSKEYARVIDAYFKNYPRQIIQAKHRKITNKYRVALAHSQANGKVKDQITNLLDYNTNPRADWGLVRQVNFASTLGLNPASAVLQLTTLGTTLPATIMQWQGSPIAALGTIGKATADAKRVLDIVNNHKLVGMLVGKTSGGERLANLKMAEKLLGGVLSKDEIALVVQMYAEGDIVPVMTQTDVLGGIPTDNFANRKMYHARLVGDSIMKTLAGPMATTEQFSRLTSVLATHRSMKNVDSAVVHNALSDDGNYLEAVKFNLVRGMSEEDAIKHAAIQNTIDNTHAIFGKFARNWNQRGFFGALPFAFMNFPIQAMEYLLHLSKRMMIEDKNDPASVARARAARMSMAYLVTAMFMMGGLAGMPAWELFKSLFEKVYYWSSHEKIDLNYEIQNVLAHSANMPSPLVHALMEGGVSAITGTNVGSRLSIPFFWQGLLGSALKGEVAITDAMGVQGGLVNNAIRQFGKVSSGDASLPEAAIMGLSPVFVRNGFEALVGWPNDGVRTGRGNVVLTPEDVTVADQLKKVLGFMPESVGNAKQAEYVQNLKTQGPQEYKSAKTSELANLKLDIFRASSSGNTGRAETLRKEYNAKYQELLEFMRNSGNGGLTARSIDGIKSAIDQKYQAKKNPKKERTAKEQRIADQVRDTYGLNKKE